MSAPRRVAVGVFLDVRTLPDNLLSWRAFLIDPLLAGGAEVHMYLSLKLTDVDDPKIVNLALKLAGLTDMVLGLEYYLRDDAADFIHETNSAECADRRSDDALLAAYYARMNIGRNMAAMGAEHAYDLVVYLRSDVTFAMPSAEAANPLARLSLLDHVAGHNGSSRIAWAPNDAGKRGLSDSVLVLTAPAFAAYHSSLRRRLLAYCRACLPLRAELLNTFLLEQARIEQRPAWMCLGVRQVLAGGSCVWSRTGEAACEHLGLPPLRLSFDEAWLLPQPSARVHCAAALSPVMLASSPLLLLPGAALLLALAGLGLLARTLYGSSRVKVLPALAAGALIAILYALGAYGSYLFL